MYILYIVFVFPFCLTRLTAFNSVFVWVPSLKQAAGPSADLPLGYIFSAFMVSMMIGSQLYNAICSYPPPNSKDSSLSLHAKLSSLVCAISALAFAISVAGKEEHSRFWAFCAFEACVGMYYPVQGMLRSTFIANEHRATVSHLSEGIYTVKLNLLLAFLALSSAFEHLCCGKLDNGGVRSQRQGSHFLRGYAGGLLNMYRVIHCSSRWDSRLRGTGRYYLNCRHVKAIEISK